ncbi:MAG: hypothetical protein R3B52_00895 [Candidatus Paceibacterota bacterium]
MRIEFLCIKKDKRYHRVMRAGLQVFCGTKGECDRYIEVYQDKMRREEMHERRVLQGLQANLSKAAFLGRQS